MAHPAIALGKSRREKSTQYEHQSEWKHKPDSSWEMNPPKPDHMLLVIVMWGVGWIYLEWPWV
jgi:hypothetical protein